MITAARMVAMGEYADDGVASAMKARDYKDATDLVAHSLRAEGFDASEDGTGRGTPIVPVQHPVAIQERAVSENPNAGPDGKGWRDDGAAYTLEARSTVQEVASAFTLNTTQLTSPQNGQDLGPGKPCHSLAAKDHPPAVAIAFSSKDHGADAMEECSPTLRAGGHAESHANAGVPPAIAFKPGSSADDRSIGAQEEVACTLEGGGGGNNRQAISAAWGVRRLTPTECERLQGFPDGWTAIPWGKKPAEECPDGPRYKALGNSMAVNVMCFIGERIKAVIEAGEGA